MNPIRAITLKICSVMVFTGMATIVKSTAGEVPAGEQVFFRSFFAIPPLLVWLMLRHEFPGALATANPLGHFWRSLVGVSAMACGFLSLGLLPFPEAVAIGYAAPVFATIFAAMFIGEQVRAYRLASVALGLVGVTMILVPRLTVLDPVVATKLETVGAFSALLGAIFAALAQVFVRKLVQVETTAAIVFYFSVIASALALVTLPFGWVVPRWETALLLVLAGLLGGLGQVLLTSAFRYAETSVIVPFEYTSMLFALAIGYFLFAEEPTWIMIGGAVLVALAGIFIIWRERQLGIRRARARKVMTPQG
ncbi:MAG TPA: DMT family transporter [Paracoccaceae bacterium]|nr:DMT family transporter [Paracoccaceae bacterium]